MTAPPILCVGRLYCDLIFTGLPRMPTLGTEIYASGVSLHAGGGASITAAHLASLGHAASLCAMLPAAPFGALVQAELQAAAVDLRLCQAMPQGADPQITVSLTGPQDRAFVTRRAGAPCPPLKDADLARLGARHLHIGELATLVECPDLIGVARRAGATLSLDCAWDEGLAQQDVKALLSQVDVFLPNEDELHHLRSLGLSPPHAPLTIVKKGARGATALAGAEEIHASAVPLSAVDTTGAGDAFNAGFLSAWLAGDNTADCLKAGNAQGARAIQQCGGFQADQPETPHRARELTRSNEA